MSLIKESKIPTAAAIMGPLTKTLGKLKAAQGARKEHISSNNEQIAVLNASNQTHQSEIDASQRFITGFEKTFGIK